MFVFITSLWREHKNGYTDCFIDFTSIETLYALFLYTIAHTTFDTILYYNIVGIVALKQHYSYILIAYHFPPSIVRQSPRETGDNKGIHDRYIFI